MKSTQVARLLAYMTGVVNQDLLLQNEYLAAETEFFGSIFHLACGSVTRNAVH
jgi:hypothetical protein